MHNAPYLTVLPHSHYGQIVLEYLNLGVAKVPAIVALATEKWQSIAAISNNTLHTRPFSSNV